MGAITGEGLGDVDKLPQISESEWKIMTRLWARFPMTAVEIVETELGGKRLPDATVRTLLRRLVAKKAIGYTVDPHNANLYHYHPLICERDCVKKENRRFMELYYQSNAARLFVAFMDDAKLSDEEIERLKQRLDEMKERNNDSE